MVIEFYYHPQSSPCQAVWMVLKELEIPHKANFIDLWTGEQKKEEFTAINKYQAVPALVDEDITISESRAIAIYLCNKYEAEDKKEKLYPTDIKEIARFNRILFRDVDNYKTMIQYLNCEGIFSVRDSGPREDLLPKAQAVLKEVDDLLSENPYVFGKHLTLLDYFILSTVTSLDLVDMDWKDYPNITKWRSNLEKLSYYEECFAKGLQSSKQQYKELCEKAKSKTKK